MIKPSDPRELAIDLLPRSICTVQVAAVIADKRGIFAWGWNSAGNGFGEHAEAAAIRRGSRDRMVGATIYVASRRQRTGRAVMSLPCDKCLSRILKAEFSSVWYRDHAGVWRKM